MTMTLDGTNGVTFNDASLQGAAASPYVLKNRITNGAMMIDQRYAGAATANTIADFTLDRWSANQSVTGKIIVQQNAAAVTPPAGFNYYLGVTSQSSYVLLTGSYYFMQQSIEGYNVADLAWGTADAKTITISFWVRSSLTGTFSGALVNSGSTRSYPFTYTISVANTWELKSVTIAGDTSGTWLNTSGVGIRVNFSLGTGTTYSGTAGAWASAFYVAATGATSVVSTNTATWYVTGVQLEVGSTATPFERRLYNQELANCQRYYYKTTPLTGNQPAYGVLGSLSTTRSISMHPVSMPVTMRTSPTVGYNSVQITNAVTSTISSTISSVTTYNTATASNYVTLDIAYSAGGSSGNVYALSANAAGSYLDFSAEF